MDPDSIKPTIPRTGMREYATSRPRVLGWLRSAAILDGDWGTSIAYVMGIGFALAGYSSFWYLCMMLVLTTLIAINYITICRLYPGGGGVYSSVYHRSPKLAVVGALLLSADYVVTMSISILAACYYLDLPNPVFFAIAIIMVIGIVNWFGPKHSGGIAVGISLFTILVLITIIISSVDIAFKSTHIVRPEGGLLHNWGIFIGFILSLSGIEAISNMTGLMKDPARDSRRAILSVLAKVIIANVFLGLAMHAVVGLNPGDHTEDMLRFLGEHYVGPWFGWFVALSLGTLLISAGNTALNDLVSIQFLMSVDKELPISLRRLNKYGMPILPLMISTIVPIVVLLFVHDIETLAHLYAIGLVGAMIINLGSTATDKSVSMNPFLKILMLISATVLVLVEFSIAIEKHEATIYASIILLIGLSARQIVRWRHAKKPQLAEVQVVVPSPIRKRRRTSIPSAKYLLAIKDKNDKLLKFAIEEARQRKALLFILRVKEIAVGALPEKMEINMNGVEEHIDEICANTGIDYQIISIPSYEVGYTIAEQAATFGVDRVIMGASKRSLLQNVLRGNVMRSLSTLLPEDVQLVIFGG